MNIFVEDLKKLKEVPDGIEEVIKEGVKNKWNDESNIFESDFYIDVNGIGYAFTSIEEGDWDDEGKYSFATDYFQLASFDCKEIKYLCAKNIIEKFNLFASVGASRSGSYYTDYYYNYDSPEYFKGFISHIPEVVIPAHDKVDFK